MLGVVAIAAARAFTVNWLSALLGAGAILFYVFVYTMVLKRRTPQNIVWGGAAGCMPVLIGWAAVTGSLGWPPVVLFGVVFFWTPPHFWALAMRFRDDYARGRRADAARWSPPPPWSPGGSSRYSWVMVATSLLLWPVAPPAGSTAAVAVAAGAWFLVEAHRLLGRVRSADRGPGGRR